MSGVTFKCISNGNTVTFKDQVDIDSMKGHPDYEVVETEYKGERVVLPTYEESLVVEPKRMGRPPKKG